jgi:hypothetical protein
MGNVWVIRMGLVWIWREEGGRMPSVLGWRNGWALYQPVNWSQQCSSFLLAPHSERQNTDEKEKGMEGRDSKKRKSVRRFHVVCLFKAVFYCNWHWTYWTQETIRMLCK